MGLALRHLAAIRLARAVFATAMFHSPWWFVALPLAGSGRQRGYWLTVLNSNLGPLFNPLIVAGVMLFDGEQMDMATFAGWIQAKMRRDPVNRCAGSS
ncbi:MAG: hypothetical protein IPJ30_20855 [Acidobacteria bacterium]|nr:hypothetical protein [Acidobacteriota bacterium]